MTHVSASRALLSKLREVERDLFFDTLNEHGYVDAQPSEDDPDEVIFVIERGPGGTCHVKVDTKKMQAKLVQISKEGCLASE